MEETKQISYDYKNKGTGAGGSNTNLYGKNLNTKRIIKADYF